jgi:uncharacterized protein (DUF433 family)
MMGTSENIYRGQDPVDVPAYSPAIAAHHLRLPTSTVRYWALGRASYAPVIVIADRAAELLSFRNLIELHVLSAIRREHKVPLQAARRAVGYLRRKFQSQHPLSDDEMSTDGRDLFVEKYGQIINASREGQVAMRELLDAHLKRIDRDNRGDPVRLFPFTRPFTRPQLDESPRALDESPRAVVIDPRVQFGRPCISGTGVPTLIIFERFQAGEALTLLAEDYGRDVGDLEEAVRYESAAAIRSAAG